jgi:hypothetical protein
VNPGHAVWDGARVGCWYMMWLAWAVDARDVIGGGSGALGRTVTAVVFVQRTRDFRTGLSG